jgi:hypothetical protein
LWSHHHSPNSSAEQLCTTSTLQNGRNEELKVSSLVVIWFKCSYQEEITNQLCTRIHELQQRFSLMSREQWILLFCCGLVRDERKLLKIMMTATAFNIFLKSSSQIAISLTFQFTIQQHHKGENSSNQDKIWQF